VAVGVFHSVITGEARCSGVPAPNMNAGGSGTLHQNTSGGSKVRKGPDRRSPGVGVSRCSPPSAPGALGALDDIRETDIPLA